MLDQNGGKFECLQKFIKKIAFYPNRKIFPQKFIRWNAKLDERKFFWHYGHFNIHSHTQLVSMQSRTTQPDRTITLITTFYDYVLRLNVEKTMYPTRSSHSRKEKMNQWLSHNVTINTEKRGGWVGRSQAMVNGNKKTENPVKPCDLDPRTIAPRLPDVCEKNVFRFSQRKPTLFLYS